MNHLDFIDICAIMLLIWFMIAKLDAQGRSPESFPQVPLADFERWRSWTVSIYRLGATACFARVVFHQAWSYYAARHVVGAPAAPKSLVLPALIVDALFFAAVVSTFLRGASARRLRRELGIVLSPISPKQAAVMSDKDAEGILSALEPVVQELVITTNSSPRAMDPDVLAGLAVPIFGEDRFEVRPRLDDAIEEAIHLTEDELSGGGVIVTGSVVTAGEARALFGKEPA